MTEPPDVIVPYARFVECQRRRQRMATALTHHDPPPVIDAEVIPEAIDLAAAPHVRNP
jgi:hypothetical protein